MSDKPLISFVLPSYNRVAWVGEALQGLLGQTIKNIEVLVVDDGSTDGSDELYEWFKKIPEFRLIKNEKNLGAGPSRNIGAKEAKADIIGICDSDDVYAAEHAELILKHFSEHPESELVNFGYMSVGYFNETLEEFPGEPFDYERFKDARGVNYFCNPSSAVRKDSFLAMGGYPKENEKETDDMQFVRKWIESGRKIDYVPGYLPLFHRVLPDSMMTKHRGWNSDWLVKK